MKFSTRVAKKRDTSWPIKTATATSKKKPVTPKAMNRPMRGEAFREVPSSMAALCSAVKVLVAAALVVATLVAAVAMAVLVAATLVPAVLVADARLVPAGVELA